MSWRSPPDHPTEPMSEGLSGNGRQADEQNPALDEQDLALFRKIHANPAPTEGAGAPRKVSRPVLPIGNGYDSGRRRSVRYRVNSVRSWATPKTHMSAVLSRMRPAELRVLKWSDVRLSGETGATVRYSRL